MRKFGKLLLTTTAIGLGFTALILLSSPPDANETTPTKPTPTHTPVNISTNFPPIDYPRLHRMQYLLRNINLPNVKEYNKLCLEATTTPVIGMTIDQARNTTWCFPYSRNITTTAYGERVQEVYTKTLDSSHAFKYLYFENGKLTTIQE